MNSPLGSPIITTESPTQGANPTPATLADEDDSEFRRETLLRTVDADTGAAVSNVVVDVAVSEAGRSYAFGTYKSNKHGQILFDYAPSRFEELKFRLTGAATPPLLITVTSEDGFYAPEIPLRLKPSPAQNPARSRREQRTSDLINTPLQRCVRGPPPHQTRFNGSDARLQ